MIVLTQMKSRQFDGQRGEKLQQHLSQLQSHLGKDTPNTFFDSHPNFVKNRGEWEVLNFFFFKETKSATMNIFRKKKILFKSFVKVGLSYVFTINLCTIA